MGNAGARYYLVKPLIKQKYLRLLVLPIAALACALASFSIQHSAFKPKQVESSVYDFKQLQAEFEFLDRPKTFSTSHSVTIAINSIFIQDHLVKLSARGELGFRELDSLITPGQKAQCTLQLSPTRKSAREAFRAHCVDEIRFIGPKPWSVFQELRGAFRKQAIGVSRDATGLVAGLAIGETDQISDSLKRKMKTVSLTHLTAVSGANCIIVLGFVFVIIRHTRANRWWRLLLGLAALIFYVLLVGSSPSVLRAAVMAGAVMLGSALGRKSEPLYALALAVLVLLVADPWLSIDYGFALSVAATAGILILGKPITQKLSKYFPKAIAVAISIALAAQIICLPVLLQLQGGLATYSVIANVAAESLIAPITILGILACCFAWIVPAVSSGFYYLASLGTWLIAEIAKYFSALPQSQIAWPTGIFGVLVSVATIFAFLFWLRSDSEQLQNIGKATLAIVLAATIGFLGTNTLRQLNWPMGDWRVVACDVGQGDAIVIRSQGKIALIDVGREPELVSACLSELAINRIDLLVLTHFDMDHVGGLSGVIESREIRAVMLSPFTDQRWGATGTLKQLQSIGAPVSYGEVGMHGQLGSASWQVLNPRRDATGSEDSNDASLVLWFEFQEFNFLAMADIGERGQMRMSESNAWLTQIRLKPLVLKVSHHGSADQYPELLEALHPQVALISVGAGNSYGHPTDRTLQVLKRVGTKVLRTDMSGSIALDHSNTGIEYAAYDVG